MTCKPTRYRFQIPAVSSKYLDAGYISSITIDTDNYIFMFGNYNTYISERDNEKPLYDGSVPNYDFKYFGPVKNVSVGRYNGYAVKDDGTLWAWGSNQYGQMGQGTISTGTLPERILYPPTKIGIANNWQSINTNGVTTLAIKQDGTMWGWGNNASSILSNGATGPTVKSPTQITNTTGWNDISIGDNHVLALKDDGSVWAWGQNSYNQLGDGTTTTTSVPKHVLYSQEVNHPIYPGNITLVANNLYGPGSLTKSSIPDSGSGSNAYWNLAPPFPITWFGTDYNNLKVNANSSIELTNPGSVTGIKITQDANNSASAIYYGVEGRYPNRRYRVRYEGTYSTGGDGYEQVLITNIPSSILGPASLTHVIDPTVIGPYVSGDDSYWEIDLPWTINAFNTFTNKIYVSSNSFISFIDPLTAISVYGISLLEDYNIPSIAINIGDWVCTGIYYGIEGTVPNRTFRIRYEGYPYEFWNTFPTGSPDPDSYMEWEAVFHENDTSKVDIQIGQNDLGLYGEGFALLSPIHESTIWDTIDPSTPGSGYQIDLLVLFTVSTLDNTLLGRASLTADSTPTVFDSTGYNGYWGAPSWQGLTEWPAGFNSYWQVVLPWNVNFLGTEYGDIYVGCNSIITFGYGVTDYYNHPEYLINAILLNTEVQACPTLYYGIEGTAPNRTFRIRYEGYFIAPRSSNRYPIGSGTINYNNTFSITTPDLLVTSEYYKIGSLGDTDWNLLTTNSLWINQYRSPQVNDWFRYNGVTPTGTGTIALHDYVFDANGNFLLGPGFGGDMIWEAVLYENDHGRIDIQIGQNDFGGWNDAAIIDEDGNYLPSILANWYNLPDITQYAGYKINWEIPQLPGATGVNITWEVRFYESCSNQVGIQIGNNILASPTGPATAHNSGIYGPNLTYATFPKPEYDKTYAENVGMLLFTYPEKIIVDSPEIPQYWKVVTAGTNFSVAIKNDLTLWSWGDNAYGQLGHGDTTLRSSATQIGTSMWKDVSAGNYHTLGIKYDGTLWSWGRNNFGQLGIGNQNNSTAPVQIGNSNNWKQVSAGENFSIALDTDGMIWGWGKNSECQLYYDNKVTFIPTPINISDLVYADRSYDLDDVFVRKDRFSKNILWGTGDNYIGQLGVGDTTDRNILTRVGADHDWYAAAAGYSHTIGLKNDQSLYSWGNNTYGQLGTNDGNDYVSPIQLQSTNTWRSIATGDYHNLAIRDDNTLWSWGYNSNGQLGINTLVNSAAIVQVGSDADWTHISAGGDSSAAIKVDGSLWTWGLNSSGQLGVNDILDKDVPTKVLFETPLLWSKVSIGLTHMLGTTNDGYLWSWGDNTYGQLGATYLSNILPNKVNLDTNWSYISAGNIFSVAIKNDGTLWSWGDNTYGQLGLGDNIAKTIPTMVGTDMNWKHVKCGATHCVALKTDGTIWAWGYNLNGQLGQATIIDSLVPVQIGNLNTWKFIEAGGNDTFAINHIE